MELTNEWREVLSDLDEEDMTGAGVPHIKALESNYFAKTGERVDLNANDRDALWSAFEAPVEDEPEDDADAPVTLIASPNNPLRVTINGRTVLEMQVGATEALDSETLAAAKACDGVMFEQGE